MCMNNEELVSVIVPVYNTERYLKQCIDSILDQTYKNFEVILIDDGSTDGSGSLCDVYAKMDERVCVIHQENKGVSAARNAGMDAAQGEYLLFVDSDDQITLDAIDSLLKDAKHYSADIVSAVKDYVSQEGLRISKYADGNITQYTGIDALILSLEYNRNTYALHAKLFRRKFVEDVRFCEGRKVNEDNFFLFQCYTKRPLLIQHNICAYVYYLRPNSVSNSAFSEKYLDMLFFAEQKKIYIKQNLPHLERFAINMEISTHLFFLEVLCRTTDKRHKSYTRNSIRFVRKNYRNYSTKNGHERKMAWIVRYYLYPAYKFLVRLKYYRHT